MLQASFPGPPGVQSDPPATAIWSSRVNPAVVTPLIPTVNVITPFWNAPLAMGVRVLAEAGSTQSPPPRDPPPPQSLLSPQPFGWPSVTSTRTHFLPGLAAWYAAQNSVPPVRAPTVGVSLFGPVEPSELTILPPFAGIGPTGTAGVLWALPSHSSGFLPTLSGWKYWMPTLIDPEPGGGRSEGGVTPLPSLSTHTHGAPMRVGSDSTNLVIAPTASVHLLLSFMLPELSSMM